MTKQQIFLAEDDQTMLSLLKTLLEMEGYAVTGYHPNQKNSVVDQIAKCQPDLVILDVHLHGQNGLDILKQAKCDGQLQSIKIIISSGSDVCAESLAAGADDFLMKPYMPEELIRMIKHHLLPESISVH